MQQNYYTKEEISSIINEALEKITIVHIDDRYQSPAKVETSVNESKRFAIPFHNPTVAQDLFPPMFDDVSPIKQVSQTETDQPLQSTPLEKQIPATITLHETPPTATPERQPNDSFNSPEIPTKAKSTGGADVSRRLAMLSPKAHSEYNFNSDQSLDDADSVASSYIHSNPFQLHTANDVILQHFF